LIVLSKQIVRGVPQFHLANMGDRSCFGCDSCVCVCVCVWNRSHEQAVCFIFWNLWCWSWEGELVV